ncbi:hypothetical protein K8O93_00900 [Gordonia bronchialis]|uniref:hypothetical protein n=1 Tax=Gordonia bronchialis TaxID=2054 RepID=UPI001CBB2D0B|nr:hypothetical protein [Gordonia bronchialis]UAK38391.1 hypothetical protein K8O93_00900 [Gordonia bronchialis]
MRLLRFDNPDGGPTRYVNPLQVSLIEEVDGAVRLYYPGGYLMLPGADLHRIADTVQKAAGE